MTTAAQDRPARTVFVSHSGVDKRDAQQVKELLNKEDVDVRLDAAELQPGASFIDFMENALHDSDYCLLLWSSAARDSEWVRIEWQAALHKSIHDSPGFLIVGRLEELPVPDLLRPRLFLDLFPELNPGVAEFVVVLKGDAAAGESTGKPLTKPRAELGDTKGAQIYVTSKLFGKTFPLRVSLDTPVVATIDNVIGVLGLPRKTVGEGGVDIIYDYGLARGEDRLRETESLVAQGIAENDVLWLETSVKLVSDAEPVRVEAGAAVYRDTGMRGLNDRGSSLLLRARDVLRENVSRLGLD